MTTTVNIHEAKTHLSRLLARVEAGDEVVIAKNGTPMARLVSVAAAAPRVPGRFRGQINGVEALLDPMPQREAVLWERGTAGNPLIIYPAAT